MAVRLALLAAVSFVGVPIAQGQAERPLRQKPKVLAPDEYAVELVRTALPGLSFDLVQLGDRKVPSHVYMIPHGRRGAGVSRPVSAAGNDPQPGAAGVRGPFNPRRPVAPIMEGGEKPVAVPVAQAATKAKMEFAIRALPLRIGVISCSFPLNRQVEEFRRKLRLRTQREVLAEKVRGDKGEVWAAFGFRGLLVERAEFDPMKPAHRGRSARDWKPGEKDWEPLPLEDSYKWILLNVLRRVEEDPREYQPVIRAGLVMKMPVQLNPRAKYPDVTSRLKTIRTALTNHDRRQNKDAVLEHCLIRFLDMSDDDRYALEPGKTYRYRFKIRMANPNYSPTPAARKDTYPDLAKDKELVSDWNYVDKDLSVPADTFYYAVDVDPNNRMLRPSINETVFQFHRWVEQFRQKAKVDEMTPTGEWVIAKRVIIRRGEYLRTVTNDSEVPLKALTQHNFVVLPKVALPFGDETEWVDRQAVYPVLVDFEADEVLLLNPDGRVEARSRAADELDPVRVKRCDEYNLRIKNIKEKPAGVRPG